MGFSIGGFVSDIFGSKNEEHANAPQVDPNAYQYGGHQGGADEAANRYRQQGEGAQTRQAEQAQFQQANYDDANFARAQQQAARSGQAQAANLMMRRAMGQVPSIAQMQADRQMQQATAAQASAAASARGPAALALAQQNAANNTANAQGAISNQAQINAANERMQAEQAAFGAQSGIRGQDLQGMGQEVQRAQYDAGAANQMNLANAGLRAGQRQQNDAFQLGMTQAEMGVRGMQLGASQNQQAQQSANQLGAAGINAGVGGQNAAMNQSNAMGMVGLAANAAGSFTKAKGGPVMHGQPYLVGERGPELVVPTAPGFVIPADKTRKLLGRAEGGPMVPWVAPSTWGGGSQPAVDDQQLAVDQAQRQGEVAQAAYQQANERVDPYQRDLDQVRTLRAISPSLVDEEDQRKERVARAKLRLSKGDASKAKDDDAEKQAVTEGKAVPEKPALRSRIGGAISGAGDKLQAMGSRVDTGYHGPTGFAGPNLIPVALPRANGGPMMVGMGGSGGMSKAGMDSALNLGMGGTFSGGAEQLGPDGQGRMGANTNFGIQWNNRELAGMTGHSRGMTSIGRAEGGPMVPSVYVPVHGTDEADRLRIGADDRAQFAAHADDGGSVPPASLTGRSSLSRAIAPPEKAPLAARIPVGGKNAKQKSPEELLRDADAMMAGMQAEHAARMDAGPAVHPREEGGPIEPGSEAGKLRQAYLLGRAHEVEKNKDFAYGGPPTARDEIVDRDPMHSASPPARSVPVPNGPSIPIPVGTLVSALFGPFAAGATTGAELGKRFGGRK